MPFEIVRNDIVNMETDAIVNTANPKPIIGSGCDAGIHKAAGPQLLEARREIGNLAVGEAAITPAFDLHAKYVIHTVGPIWQDGDHGEETLLRQCYDRSLALALENGCTSIAFPLLATGNYGFPKPKALQIAISAFSSFLLEHEMQIYLVVFSKDAYALSEKLFHSIESYIDENYVGKKALDEYGFDERFAYRDRESTRLLSELQRQQRRRFDALPPNAAAASENVQKDNLATLIKETDAGFSETLLKLIDRTGKKDAEIYKKANVDRKLFSKIRNNPQYQPKKTTAVAFALALELSLPETRELIGRAGYALTHSSKFDIIVEYFIKQKNYDVMELNEVLFAFDQPLIGV